MMLMLISNVFALTFTFDKPVDVTVPVSGLIAPLYASLEDSDVATYKTLTYDLPITETEVDIVTSGAGETYVGTFLFENEIGVDKIPEGEYYFHIHRKLSTDSGFTNARLEVFMYESNGTETDLFSFTSEEINDLDYALGEIRTSQVGYDVNPDARFGVRAYIITDRVPPLTLSFIIGDGRASYMTTPLSLRHSLLRELNGDDDFQHINISEKEKLQNLSDNYLAIDGSNADQDIDIGEYNFSTNGNIKLGSDGEYVSHEIEMWAENGYTADLIFKENENGGFLLSFDATENNLFLKSIDSFNDPKTVFEVDRFSRDVMFSDTVHVDDGVNVAGLSKFTDRTWFAEGVATGAIVLGADLNGESHTNNVRKFGSITMRNYANTAYIEVISGDSTSSTSNKLNFGGREGGSSETATDINFLTSGTVKMQVNSDVDISTDLNVDGNVGIQNSLAIGSNSQSGLSNGGINASTIYYDALVSKSPTFLCSAHDNKCFVIDFENEKEYYVDIDNDYNIVSFKNKHDKDDKKDLSDTIKNKFKKLKDDKLCSDKNGYLNNGNCYKSEQIEVSYNEAVEIVNFEEEIIVESICTELNSDLEEISISCGKSVKTDKIIQKKEFKEGCKYNNGYYCKVEVQI